MNRHRGITRGFTLVELLVVISIIGMLMALLLPAVQAARETGRRNTCQSNQHNVSLALIQFAEAKKYFPGWENNLPTTNTTSPNMTVSWVVPLLPYMERTDVYNVLQAGNTTTIPNALVYMAVLVCPSNPPVTTSGASPLAYCINGGQNYSGTPVPSANTTQQLSAASASGIAYDLAFSNTPTPVGAATPANATNVKVSQDYVVSHDGSTATLLVSENDNIANQSWTPPSASISTYLSTSPPTLGNYSSSNGFGFNGLVFQYAAPPTSATLSQSAPTNYYRINGNKGTAPTPSATFLRPASNHPGGVVVGFCGGNVRFLAEDIPYYVYKQLMTPFGNGATSPTGTQDTDLFNIPLNENTY